MTYSPKRESSNKDSSKEDPLIRILSREFGIDSSDYQIVFKDEGNNTKYQMIGISCQINGVAIFLCFDTKLADNKNSSNVFDALKKSHSNEIEKFYSELYNLELPSYGDLAPEKRVLFHNFETVDSNQVSELEDLIRSDGDSLSGVIKIRVQHGKTFGYLISPLEQLTFNISLTGKEFPILSTYLVVDFYKLMNTGESNTQLKDDISVFITNRLNATNEYILKFYDLISETSYNMDKFYDLTSKTSFSEDPDNRIKDCVEYIEIAKEFKYLTDRISSLNRDLKNIHEKIKKLGNSE